MTLTRTLAHCTAALEMGMGRLNPKPASLPATLLGRLIKPFVLRDSEPMRRNSPSSPELFPQSPEPHDFDLERSRLVVALDSFASEGPQGCTTHPHPFFGPLTPRQWSALMYKHLDHHLRQFGV